MKRLDNATTNIITTARGRYAVTLDRLTNDRNGNTRYKAFMIILEVFSEVYTGSSRTTHVYTFTGHYCGDIGECEHVVNYYENSIAK